MMVRPKIFPWEKDKVRHPYRDDNMVMTEKNSTEILTSFQMTLQANRARFSPERQFRLDSEVPLPFRSFSCLLRAEHLIIAKSLITIERKVTIVTASSGSMLFIVCAGSKTAILPNNPVGYTTYTPQTLCTEHFTTHQSNMLLSSSRLA